MILITGATGNLGALTIEFLLQKGVAAENIVALVRDKAKAAHLKTKGVIIRLGDYNNYESLIAGFQGIDKLLLISGNDLGDRTRQHENVIRAAIKADVKQMFYTSFERKNESDSSPIHFIANSHIRTEQLLKDSGIPYTIFRNNLYQDILPMFFGEKVIDNGIFLPAGTTKAAFTSRRDIAEATANILIGKGHENKEYALSNTENISMIEIASILSELTGKKITYHNPSVEEYISDMTKAGVPDAMTSMLAGFAEAVKQGEFERYKTDLENILGKEPISMKAFLTQLYKH